MRNTNPIDDDDDDIREGSIHGMAVPLNESLFADIGTDDMSGFADADKDVGEFAARLDEQRGDLEPSVTYDLDADEPPSVSLGTGRGQDEPEVVGEVSHDYAPAHNEYESSDAEAQTEFAQSAEQEYTEEQPQYQYTAHESTEPEAPYAVPSHLYSGEEAASAHTEEPTAESSSYQYSEEAQSESSYQYETEPEAPVASEQGVPSHLYGEESASEQAVPSHLYGEESATEQAVPSHLYGEESTSEPSVPAHLYGDEPSAEAAIPAQLYGDEPAAGTSIPAHLYGDESAAENAIPAHLYGDESVSSTGIPSHLYGEQPSAAPAYDASALDCIGSGAKPESEPTEAEPPIERPRSKPTGILSKFTGKKDAAKTGPAPAKEETQKLDSAALNAALSTGGGGKGFDSSTLDAIGTKGGFDSAALDSIGSKGGFDSAALDSIGSKGGFDSAALDSIGSKSKFDSAALDSIGAKGGQSFDAASLDAIGAPAAETPADPKDKPAPKGGLLGGKFGQRAKSGDKPKLGAVHPSNDPSMPQKETGLFMLDKAALVEKADRIRAQGGESLDSETPTADAPAAGNFDAPLGQSFEVPAQELPADFGGAATAPAASGGGSFFDEASEPFSEEHAMPDTGNDEIARLLTDADNAYRLRQYKAAEPIFANVLDKLDKVGDDADPLLPYCLDRMGDNLYQLKRFNEALPLYRRLLQLQTKISAEDRDMISTLYKIAQTSEALNLTSEADSMYKRAFRLGQQSLVPGDPLLAKVLEGYGTMLMRSEGAEPPSAASEASTEKSTDSTEKASSLSAADIAALNALNVKADGSEPSPIILSGGPASAPADASLSRSGSRTPLRESEDRTDRRASGPGPGGTTAGSMYVRLGLFIAVIAGMLFLVFNLKSDFSAKHITHSKDFKTKVYKSLDGASTFTIANEDEAQKDAFGKKFLYRYSDWNGSMSDDMSVITGQVGGDSFIYMVPQGVKDSDGLLFYDASAPERAIVAKMRELGAKAQEKYKAEGKYPEGKALGELANKINYKNQFGDAGVTASSIAWPPLMDASQVFVKSRLDNSLEQGGTWEGEAPAKPGQISAVSSEQKSPDASILYIHGRDRDGNLLTRADGKTLVLSFKNGIDVTPTAVDTKGETPTPEPKDIKVAKSGAPVNAMSVLMGYLPIIFFLLLTVVFLAMANKGSDPTKGFNIATVGMIWAPIMVLLTMLMKMAPPSLYPIALGATFVGLIGGLGFIAFKAISTRPKKPKKPKIEASSM